MLAPGRLRAPAWRGRKQRSVPLWRSTVLVLRAWLRLNPDLGARQHYCPIEMVSR
ncbi:MAG: hypothetical protein IPG34_17750 [Rhodocyclaceae bacterium]|nr:hypothetical protein [Rhodocyclaceae bacterium]